jgi:hypothetical protein
MLTNGTHFADILDELFVTLQKLIGHDGLS